MNDEPILTPSSVRFGTLYEVAKLVSSSLDLDVVLERVMDAVIGVTGAERGLILLSEPGGSLTVAVARNLDHEELDPRSGEVSRTLCNQVAESGEGILVDDALADARTATANSVRSLQIRSVLCAPLRTHDRTIGVVYLDHRSAASRFTERELRLLEAVSEQAAIAIENARLHQHLQLQVREIAGLKAYLDSIFQSVATAIVGLDLQGHVVSVNRAAEALFGTRAADVRGESYVKLFGDVLSARLFRSLTGAVEGEASPAMVLSTVLAGDERHVSCGITPLRDEEGKISGLIFLAEDHTARVLAENAREREKAERQRIRDLFGRFVSEPVVQQLLVEPERAQLGAARREVTALFADVREYSGLSEQRTPEELAEILGRYLALAADSVLEHWGTLDKFSGDGVMAVFNAPLDLPHHAVAALRAAWMMQRRAAEELEGLTFGVGINTGDALVGVMGTDRFRNYVCTGDAVNVAFRLQELAPGGQVLLSRATLDAARQRVRAEPLGPTTVKGRAAAIETYRLLEVLP